MKKAFYVLFGTLILCIVIVTALLVINVGKVGAASVCGRTVGNAAIVENAMVIAGVPHIVLEGKTAPIVTCQAIGCPRPRPATCLGWNIRLTATPTRWIELAFGKTGVFYGVK